MSTEPFTVEGERIALIPVGPEHAVDVYEILQDPAISKTTTIPFPYSMEMAQQWTGASEGNWRSGSPDWAIIDRQDGRMVAAISLTALNRKAGCFEIGYWTATKRWGEGLMSEAVRLAASTAFERLGATRIEWYAHVGNWGSWKPVWRCGFRREGIERRFDEGDMWKAGLVKSDPMEPATPWDGPCAGHGPALDPSKPQALVEQFHRTYSMPIRLGGAAAPTIDYERLDMRMSLIGEEFSELMGAVYGAHARHIIESAIVQAVAQDDRTRDIVETADALADLVYVIYGMAIESGIDLDRVLAEVQASNLSKLMPDGTVRLREDGKVLKGPDFFAPNVRRALGMGSDT
ncbi:GNAT family N-acetyltransferase [Actinomyces mediterranea]|uniref:GNAT family N-acetyltransferase n=1 Tax=Actinomyces mediterranea TaxID=1871028 RepID=UPI000970EC85|nr:GNAT family N-acetyltransferase [Actinomyces mediterranea]